MRRRLIYTLQYPCGWQLEQYHPKIPFGRAWSVGPVLPAGAAKVTSHVIANVKTMMQYWVGLFYGKSLAAHREYRPDPLGKTIGQGHVTSSSERAIGLNRVAQACPFSGARGCGEATAARAFARLPDCREGPKAGRARNAGHGLN